MKPIALVTGASSGIGKAIAKQIADHYQLIICGRRTSRLLTLSKELHNKTQTLIGSFDVRDQSAVSNFIETLPTKWQNISVLINNAGITSDQLFLRMKDEEWDNVIATNLTGTFNLTKALIKNMIKNRYGRIINISSVSGLMGNPGQVNYSSAKAGLSGFTKSLAKEVGSRSITVNSVAPGFIETDMTAYLDDNAKTKLIEDIPLKRLGSVQDISDLVMFLSSEDASYITGQTISVDGGLFMY